MKFLIVIKLIVMNTLSYGIAFAFHILIILDSKHEFNISVYLLLVCHDTVMLCDVDMHAWMSENISRQCATTGKRISISFIRSVEDLSPYQIFRSKS